MRENVEPTAGAAKNTVACCCLALAFAVGWSSLLAAQIINPPPDWQAQVRSLVSGGDLATALEIAEQRLQQAPQDLEARGWRARLLAWTRRWAAAEEEYRRVLAATPDDADILLGLADVLAWQQRWQEALTLLERAQRVAPQRTEVAVRQGRVLRALGRVEQARATFRAALQLDPNNAEARAALAAPSAKDTEFRHELRLGTDADVLSFTENGYGATLSLHSRWTDRWTTSVAGFFQHRFNEDAGKFSGAVTYRLSRRDALTVGGAVARDFGVIPRGETFFEWGHGFSWSGQRLFRGAEVSYRQQWLWFREARVLTLTPSVLVYLPRDWSWALAVTAARSRFPGTRAEWRPAGATRLSIPIRPRLKSELLFAVGTENFAQRDQVGRFSARSWGGGLRWRVTPRHEIAAYVVRQGRSQGRAQTSFGWSYAFRF